MCTAVLFQTFPGNSLKLSMHMKKLKLFPLQWSPTQVSGLCKKILLTFIWRAQTSLLLEEIPQHRHSIFHYGVKIGKIHCFESVDVPDVKHQCNQHHVPCKLGIIWSVWFFQFGWLLTFKPNSSVFIDSSIYISAPVSTGNTSQDLPQLCETVDNTERYICDIRVTNGKV
jgi:hypothetical protein